jgi:hypothetical protein
MLTAMGLVLVRTRDVSQGPNQPGKEVVDGVFFCCVGSCLDKQILDHRVFYKCPANSGIGNIWKHLASVHGVARPKSVPTSSPTEPTKKMTYELAGRPKAAREGIDPFDLAVATSLLEMQAKETTPIHQSE